jgi:ATP-dependent exoDNAse (exonuclease V) alpha subunit
MSVLQRILDVLEPNPIARPTLYLEQWSEQTRSKVKQAFAALGKDGQTARIEHHWYFGRVMAIRPKDLDKFKVALAERHLMTDSLVQGMVGVLKEDSEHFVKWAIKD